MKILIAEDDEGLAQHLRRALVERNHAVDVTHDGEAASTLASTEMYDVIVLDIMLPKRSGLDVLSSLRKSGMATPVLLLTARDQVSDKVTGLDLGADDYMTKPFALAELLARVRALGRRRDGLEPSLLSCGDLVLDPRSHETTWDGKDLKLTAKEFAVLHYLMLHEGAVVTHVDIMEKVWNVNYYEFSDVVKVVISRLRKKLETPGRTPLIHTVRGVGYIMREPADEAETEN